MKKSPGFIPLALHSQTQQDYAQDHSNLGAALNVFGLNESVESTFAIERTGQELVQDKTFIYLAPILIQYLYYSIQWLT
jgi:hypothetical protein